jgi:putative Mg2+ transporter-C (MgtC) family protein
MALSNEYTEMVFRLLAAVLVGGLIGLERSYHGRPAGFRTHTLVCTASSLLMLVTVYEALWFTPQISVRVALDPTRMAQGIMTGIGFLGAGVIVKEGITVRGLTTAASIWITSAIGILMGIGFYFPAGIATVLTLGVLSLFRWIESQMPIQTFSHFSVRFLRDDVMPEPELRELIGSHECKLASLAYRLSSEGKFFEYRGVISTQEEGNVRKLSETLRARGSVIEFRLASTTS